MEGGGHTKHNKINVQFSEWSSPWWKILVGSVIVYLASLEAPN